MLNKITPCFTVLMVGLEYFFMDSHPLVSR